MKRYPRHIARGRGNRFIVPISGGYSTADELAIFIASAPAGAIAIIDPETKDILTTALAEGDKYQFIQKLNTTENEVAYSDVYTHTTRILCATNTVAGVNQVTTLTVTSVATTVGQVFEMSILDQTYGTHKSKNHLFEFVSVTGAETAAQIAAGIYDNYLTVSERQDLHFTVAVAGAVLTVTTKDKETNLDVGAGFGLLATKAITTAYVSANGTGETTYMEELAGSGYDGLSAYGEHEFVNMGNMTPFSKTSCSYDEIAINNNQEFETLGHVTGVTMTTESPTVLRIETTAAGTSGSATYTAIKTILGL